MSLNHKMDEFYEKISQSAMNWSKDDIWFHLWKQEKVASLQEDLPVASNEVNDLEFDDDNQQLEWINIPYKYLSLQSDLRGRIVILDFFTTCCINCIHSLAELQQVKSNINRLHSGASSANIAWIGVHSPKFDYERETETVRLFCEKYGAYSLSSVTVDDRNDF